MSRVCIVESFAPPLLKNAPPKMTLHPLISKGGAFVLKLGLVFKKKDLLFSRSFFHEIHFCATRKISSAGNICAANVKSTGCFAQRADCAFFWLISGKLLVYLLLTALSMHYFGLWLDKIQSETKLLLAQTEKAERKVQLYLDAAFFAEPGLIGVHPNDNAATVWLRADDLAALIREHGNPAHIAEL